MKHVCPPLQRGSIPAQLLRIASEGEEFSRADLQGLLGLEGSDAFRQAVRRLKRAGMLRETISVTEAGLDALEELAATEAARANRSVRRSNRAGLAEVAGVQYPLATTPEDIAKIERQAREARALMQGEALEPKIRKPR